MLKLIVANLGRKWTEIARFVRFPRQLDVVISVVDYWRVTPIILNQLFTKLGDTYDGANKCAFLISNY